MRCRAGLAAFALLAGAVAVGVPAGPVAATLGVIDFESFGVGDQGARFGVDPPVEDGMYAGLSCAYDDPVKIDTWGSFTVQDSAAPGGNDSTGASIPGAGGSENWVKVRASSVGKGAKITELTGDCFTFHSMALFTLDQPTFIDQVTVTFRTCSGAEASAPLVLADDTWITVTAADLGIAAGTTLKTMWFNGAPSNPNAAKFGLDDYDVTIGVPVEPPTVTPSVVGTLGNDGWYTSDVDVTWTVDGTDITSTDGCDPTTIDSDTAGVTLTCTATNAGCTTSESVTVKRDATSPVTVHAGPFVVDEGSSVVLDGTGSTDASSGVASTAWACDGSVQESATVQLVQDAWSEVTAADLGLAPGTLLKTMWFNSDQPNPDAGKFGLDDLAIAIVAEP